MTPEPTLVVGAALLRRGRVLAALRSTPPVGRWELPGGKVEPGESAQEALLRELCEEFGDAFGACVSIVGWLDGGVEVRPGLELRIAVAEVTDQGDPEPVVHDEIRWLDADQLDTVDWLDSDLTLLPQVRAHLAE